MFAAKWPSTRVAVGEGSSGPVLEKKFYKTVEVRKCQTAGDRNLLQVYNQNHGKRFMYQQNPFHGDKEIQYNRCRTLYVTLIAGPKMENVLFICVLYTININRNVLIIRVSEGFGHLCLY